MNNDSVDLYLPAGEDTRLIARLTTVGCAAGAGLTTDAAEDVKMAVQEALNCVCGSRVHIAFRRAEDALEILVSGEGDQAPPEPVEAEVARCVLESMVDELTLDSKERIAQIRMIKRIPGGAR